MKRKYSLILPMMLSIHFWASAAWCTEAEGDLARASFTQHCASSHGDSLQGLTGPSLIKSEWRSDNAQESLANIIRGGRPALGMPAWRQALSGDEIKRIARYIQLRNLENQPSIVYGTDAARLVKGELHDFRVETVLESTHMGVSPFSMASLPNGDLLLAGQSDINLLPRSGTEIHRVEDLPASIVWSIALHPNFSANGWIYLLVTPKVSTGLEQLIRGHLASR